MPGVSASKTSVPFMGGTILPNGTPSDLTATWGDDGNIDLSWTAGSTNEDGFHIYVSIDGGDYAILATVGAGVTVYEDATSPPLGGAFSYVVTAYRGANESENSNIATADWDDYWATRLDTWLSSRDTLDFDATIGTKATILPVCGNTNGTDSFIKAPDATKAWTFGEFTLECIFELPSLPTASKCLLGRNAAGAANGDINIVILNASATNNSLLVSTKTQAASTTLLGYLSANTRYHVIVTNDAVNGLRIFLNESLSPTTGAYSTTAASATEVFSCGAYLTGTTPAGFTPTKFYSTRVYNVALTPAELTARWALTDVTRGLILAWDFMGDNESIVEHDRSGQSNHGTWVGTAPYYTYSANGCQDNLDNGYRMYRKLGAFPLYLPKLIGSEDYPAALSFPANYIFFKEVAGQALKHNLAGSKFRFPNETVWDRSNTTTNNAQSRAASTYDAGNVTDWHAWEVANYNIICSYLNTGYQGRFASKVENLADADGILRPTNIEEILLTILNQEGADLVKLLDYTNND